MKKAIFVFALLFIFIPNTLALDINPQEPELIPAELIRCDSLSNVWLKYNDEIKRVHLLAYDITDGNLNNTINNYFCELLEKSQKIEIEYDIASKDKYNREQVFIYVDDYLIQKKLIEQGYGQVGFIQDNYKYLNELCEVQKQSIINKAGIWNYPNIEEKYCNSGITLNGKSEEKEEEIIVKKKFDKRVLNNMVFLNSGILLLMLLLRRVKL